MNGQQKSPEITVRPRFVPPAYQEAADSGKVILHDGSTAVVRSPGPEDQPAMRAFFERLSPESRRRRFFTVSLPRADLIASLCDNADPRSAFTLVVLRTQDNEPRIIATASYFAKDAESAEVAFTVDDRFQGRGLGTILLERLAL